MSTFAAVDVGSNGIRIAIGQLVGEHVPHVIETIREPVRLGSDVFSEGSISEATTERALGTFERFRDLMTQYHVTKSRTIATSALREAHNQDLFIDRVLQKTNIEIDIISAEEEARLVQLAVSNSLDLRGKRALTIDIGGGSVEVVLSEDGRILTTESMKIGTVRLIQLLRGENGSDDMFSQLAHDYVQRTRKWFSQQVGPDSFDIAIGIGGNVECLGDLRRTLCGRKTNSILYLEELASILRTLQQMTYEQRINDLALRPDRADVIIPASIVLQTLMHQAGMDRIVIPKVGVKDGVLLDLVEQNLGKRRLHRDEIIHSAMQVGRKYHFDEVHGITVSKFAAMLFDQTEKIHGLDPDDRLLLEIAALLHDIGRYIRTTGHHKHTYYLLRQTPIVGLSDSQLHIVACIARYHRKAKPSTTHEHYRELSKQDRMRVSKLAALLRLAAAMDLEQNGSVENFTSRYDGDSLAVRLEGNGKLLIEQWALMKRCPLFEAIFGVKFEVEGDLNEHSA